MGVELVHLAEWGRLVAHRARLNGGVGAGGELEGDQRRVLAALVGATVGSVGALDMVNFGAIDTVPERFADRRLHVHNPHVTLMRTTVDENRQIGEFIAAKLNACPGPVRFLLPEGGVSLIDAPGQPFHDPEADEALFAAIEANVEQTDDRTVARVAANINDEDFVLAALTAFGEVMGEAG